MVDEGAAVGAAEASAPVTRIGAGSLLRDNNFRLYWSTNCLFFIGSQVQLAARAWLVLQLTSSRSILGLTGFLQGIVVVLLSPTGGVVADRMPKRNILMLSRLAFFIVSGAMTALVLTDYVRIPYILVEALAAGTVLAFALPATQSYVYDLVGREKLVRAVALNTSGTSLASLLGPTVGAVLIASAGVAWAYLLSAGGYLAGVAFLAMIPVAGRSANTKRESFRREMMDGLRIVKDYPSVRWLVMVSSFVLLGGIVIIMRVVYAKEILDVGSTGYGLMFLSFGIGAIVGSVALGVVGLPKQRVGLVAPCAGILWYGAMVIYAFSRFFPLTLLCEAMMGLAAQFYQSSVMAATQMAVPEELRSRALALVFMTQQLTTIGWLLGGALADALGDTFAVAFAGAVPIPFMLFAILFAKPLRSI